MDYGLNSSSFKEKPTKNIFYPHESNKNIEAFSVSAKYLVHVTISL